MLWESWTSDQSRFGAAGLHSSIANYLQSIISAWRREPSTSTCAGFLIAFMIVRLPTLLVAAFAAFSSSAAAAPVALVDLGEITLDPNTGLRWLDVTSSVNRSYEDVTLNLVPGGDFYGYRYATAPEVAQLFTNAGIVTPWVGNQPGPGSSDYFELMNLVGMTRVTSDSWDTFGMTAGTYHCAIRDSGSL